MKIAERARRTLYDILAVTADGSALAVTVVPLMRERGWASITEDNIIDTARALGFTVIGTVIYQLDS